ncbi:MAG: hypothetical protein CMI08_13310 [Oceanospirillaceae bacterium]|uniref:hypothetical protein n=3 Tax=unclassified Thalassolituus TaxID=2624967 RepID=UPI000C3E615E|nr:hypothetical protein [Thalassolituus sp. UBA6592]MAS24805.1 hypothetical protein [Oceanospirillaceae bacterium]MAY00151.1 hypothetical protein [Oceanospirillaceae bacterium]MBS52287.1 hypothetical protein [Oceanospirillaceae bacterium]|tara:strand:+ start:157 stop:900 length:744 start_codon:yes stop_codon:yes gene_type:complete
MSTFLLVILAVFTALSAVGALWFMRWQEQKRLERARQAVEHADRMGELSMIGETLAPWLSQGCKQFLAHKIQHHAGQLQQLGIKADQRCNRAIENANQWMDAAKGGKTPLPAQSSKAQELRNLITLLIEYIRNEYKKNLVAAAEARPLLAELKILNVRIAAAVFESKAIAAENMNNHSQAVHYLKKAMAALQVVEKPTPDIVDMLADIKQRHELQLAQLQSNNTGNRLEAAAEKLAEDDDAWKKKNF